MKAATLVMLASFLCGCARYEYDLTQPPGLARHIGPAPTTLPVDPLVYQLQTVDNHLVMDIRNPANEPILLLGERSVIVDPEGQSHRLMSQTIAPHSFIRLVLPPFPEVYEWDEPYWAGGYGGYWYYRGPRRYYRGYYGFYAEPGYAVVYDSSNPAYFDWSGETDVRMTLRFDRAGKQFDHSFAFHRALIRGKAD